MPNEVMTQEEYEVFVKKQVDHCVSVLFERNAMYNNPEQEVDRMRNFRSTAYLLHTDPITAAGSMASKHIARLYDLIADGNEYAEEVWRKAITDCINYLLIISALIQSGERNLTPPVNSANTITSRG